MFPTAFLVGRLIGRQPSIEGSGNPGASNMYRIAGLKRGIGCGNCRHVKGALPTLIALQLWGPPAALAAWLGAVLGHIWPVIGLMRGGRLRGGKGVATAGGGVLALDPLVGVACMSLFFVTWRLARRAAVASLSALLLFLVLVAADRWPLNDLAAAGTVAFPASAEDTNPTSCACGAAPELSV